MSAVPSLLEVRTVVPESELIMDPGIYGDLLRSVESHKNAF